MKTARQAASGTRKLFFLGALLMGLSATTAGACLSFRTLGQAEKSGCGTTAGFIAGTRAATARFSNLMRPEDAAKLQTLNYRQDAVVAIFYCFGTSGHEIGVQGMSRQGGVLRALVEKRAQGVHYSTPTAAYQVVAVRKSTLKVPIPTRVRVSFHSSG